VADLVYVHPRDLKQHWEYVRKGAERIKSRCDSRWDIEDLFLLLKLEKAALYMIKSEQIDAFVILQLNEGYDGKEVNIFAAYSDVKEVMEYALPLVKAEAKRIGAIRLTFCSPRDGWGKRAEQLGYKQVSVNYEMQL